MSAFKDTGGNGISHSQAEANSLFWLTDISCKVTIYIACLQWYAISSTATQAVCGDGAGGSAAAGPAGHGRPGGWQDAQGPGAAAPGGLAGRVLKKKYYCLLVNRFNLHLEPQSRSVHPTTGKNAEEILVEA